MNTPSASPPVLVELRDVTKRYGGITALDRVSIQIEAGKVLCLLGDNGAGKSTLIKVISGYHPPTSGKVLIDGLEVHFSDPRAARRAGIATVHQDVAMIPMMSVGRNFFLGAEPRFGIGPFRFLDLKVANRIALEQMRRFGIERVRDANQLVGTLSGGERQVLAISRALFFGARMLILDEPTSALGVKEAGRVLHLIQRARDQNIGIVFITHNARHAMSVGDRFVVLIQGRVAARFDRGQKRREEVLNLMAGGEQMEELEDELMAHGGVEPAAIGLD